VQKAITENLDIDSDSVIVEEEKQRVMVKDTDIGQQIQEDLNDLTELLKLY
jgi:fructose-1,6-bisphosphatase-3